MSGAVLEAPVFTAGGRTFSWGDVVDAARAWGEWRRIEALTGRRLAVEREAARAGRPPPAGEVQAAVNAFRYERRLISADELEKWLQRWGIGFDELMAYMRCVLAQQGRADLQEPDCVDGLERATWVAAICSGELVSFAKRLAEQVALELTADPEAPAFPAREALAEQAAANFISWTRVDCRYLVFAEEGPAREAALCVREDGRSIEEVADDAGVAMEQGRFYVEDAPASLGAHLLAANPGDLMGPVAVGNRFWVMFVTGRAPPSLEDTEILQRARIRVAGRALTAAVQRAVTWHDRL